MDTDINKREKSIICMMREILELAEIKRLDRYEKGESHGERVLEKKKEARRNDKLEKIGCSGAVIIFFILLFFVEDKMNASIIAVSILNFTLFLSRREKVYIIMFFVLITCTIVDYVDIYFMK